VKAFIFGAFDSLYFRGLEKGKRQRESWEGAAVAQACFAIQLSILYRMSFLAGFAELGRPAFSSQSGKRGNRPSGYWEEPFRFGD